MTLLHFPASPWMIRSCVLAAKAAPAQAAQVRLVSRVKSLTELARLCPSGLRVMVLARVGTQEGLGSVMPMPGARQNRQ